MSKTAAVYYEQDAYGTSGQRLLGRQAAGEGFLKGLVRYGQADALFCLARTEQDFSAFCQQIDPWATRSRKAVWLPNHRWQGIAQAGTLYRPDPDLSNLAWTRRFQDQRAYSLCGVTHTIASKAMQRVMGELMLAPVQPWDAVICTSQAVRRAYERIFDDWGNYLAQRWGVQPGQSSQMPVPLQLPVIPLGIDSEAFPTAERAKDIRQQYRAQLGIPEEDVVVLFVGRLIFYAKGHPVPMYLALEQAARRTGKTIHLVQAGWFENDREEQAFREAPERFCPSVNCVFLDGRLPEVRANIWSAADVFISLSDNIQETFGLTPLEAMANGLPLVVSAWDGYQESVQDGVEGFKIPTVLPPAGSGMDLAERYVQDQLNYSMYIAHPCLATMVDVEACIQALVKLIEQPELRRSMGENGRRRIAECYDWKQIIPQYEALWARLAELRATATEMAPLAAGQAAHPLCQDPFRLFAHYTPHHLSPETRLALAGWPMSPGVSSAPQAFSVAEAALQALQTDWMCQMGSEWRLSQSAMQALLQVVSQAPGLTVQAVWEQLQAQGVSLPSQAHFFRAVGYLLKFHVLCLIDGL